MSSLLYGELTPWYHLLDPAEEHAEEAESFRTAFEKVLGRASATPTLLELGSGAGHNAVHLKRRFQCTLSDVSTAMLSLSRALNPECEHVEGDMRTLRLGSTFDAVLVHDAVSYMLSEEDLLAAARTAFEHTRRRSAVHAGRVP